MPRLARKVELLPCFTYTPPSLGVAAKSSAPPRDPKAYADFLDIMITAHGRHFEWLELWNEPNNLSHWDFELDPNWACFAEMARITLNNMSWTGGALGMRVEKLITLPIAVAPALVPAMRKLPLLCLSRINSPKGVPEIRVVRRN